MNIIASVAALGRPVAFYPSIARAFGDVNAALIVCQFMYWRGRVGDREIYKTQAEIESETFVPAHTQRRVLKRLSDLGMVTIEKKGIPAKNHFVWNWDVVDAFVSDYILKSQQDVTTSANELSPLDATDCNDYSQQIVTTNTETTAETTTETTTNTPITPKGVDERPAPVKLKPKNSDDQERKFNLFWSLYPRKTNKQAAVKAWHRLKPSNDLFDKIMHALSKHCVSDGWQRDGGQYIPHPSTWINGKRWEDELPVNLPQVRNTAPVEPDFHDTTWAQNMDDGL